MKKILTNKWILATMFTLGIALAGSDGTWMPWGNIIGIAMFGAFGLIACNYE